MYLRPSDIVVQLIRSDMSLVQIRSDFKYLDCRLSDIACGQNQQDLILLFFPGYHPKVNFNDFTETVMNWREGFNDRVKELFRGGHWTVFSFSNNVIEQCKWCEAFSILDYEASCMRKLTSSSHHLTEWVVKHDDSQLSIDMYAIFLGKLPRGL